jgi:hypothetical protein
MATETDRVSLMRDELIFLCEFYDSQRERELAAAEKYGSSEYVDNPNPQVMRLRARAAVWQAVIMDLKDVIHHPIYGPIVSPEGSED